ncbi:hypothetical protein CYY_008820, partial [Polysphondylium violaceum]
DDEDIIIDKKPSNLLKTITSAPDGPRLVVNPDNDNMSFLFDEKELLIPSTKIKALMDDLNTIFSSDTDTKVIIFSQWTTMLDYIEGLFVENKWKLYKDYCRFDGRISTPLKEKALRFFNREDGPRTMLISLKCGGVGLNLTRANRVFMVDPWWNVAAEEQAIDRVHRIGQNRPVFVKRYIMHNSIEQKILMLQESKSQMSNALLSDDYDPSKPLSNYKLNLEEIKLLFT